MVIAPKSTVIKSHADLVGKKVGLTRGTGEDGLLTKAAEANPGIEMLRFDDYSSLLQAMVSGQIDAMGGGDYGEIYLKKAQNGDDFEQKYVLKTFYFGIGVAKGNDNLRQWINTWLFTLKTDGTLEGAVDEVSQPAASGAAGFLIRSSIALRRGRMAGPGSRCAVTGCP